jgi:hypothetical protein
MKEPYTMDYRRLLVAAALAVGAAAPAIAGPVGNETGPSLVTNGGFETGDFAGWNASVDPSFSGIDNLAAHSGSFGAFFGDFGTPGSISQSFATLVGASYNIHLWLRSDGLAPNSLAVLWNGTTVYSAANLAPFAYTEIVIDPQATAASTTLELRVRDDNGFLELDDISVRAVSAVPEPGSLALLGAGLLTIVAVRRRRQKP